MSNLAEKQGNDVSSVEGVIEALLSAGLPIKSVTVIRDVLAGVIMGEVDEVDEEMELAAGVSYLVIGLGKLPCHFRRGIEMVEIAPPSLGGQ